MKCCLKIVFQWNALEHIYRIVKISNNEHRQENFLVFILHGGETLTNFNTI